MVVKKEQTKKCHGCGKQRKRNEFLDSTGKQNPRGYYCIDCHNKKEREQLESRRKYQESIVRKYKIMYGEFWRHYAVPHDFEDELYNERDYCPYCGKPLPPKYVPQSEQKNTIGTRAQIDHMDPLKLGGEESIRNAVYVCDSCNLTKGAMPFTEWLKKIDTYYSNLARKIYIEKHEHTPEEFKEGCETGRYDGKYYELMFEEKDLKKMYPTPKVDGPPKKLVIKINPLNILNEPKNWSLNLKLWAIAARDRLHAQVKDAKKIAKKAKGALIIPKLEGTKINNNTYAKGVLVVRGEKDFKYYEMIPGSVEFQVSGQPIDIIIYFMADDVLNNFQASEEWEDGVDWRIATITVNNSKNTLSAINDESIVAFVFNDKGIISDRSLQGAKFKKFTIQIDN